MESRPMSNYVQKVLDGLFAPMLVWWKMKRDIPETLRRKLVKAGRIRAQKITRAQRIAWGKASWQARLSRARQQEAA